jgi:hypothetical protein
MFERAKSEALNLIESYVIRNAILDTCPLKSENSEKPSTTQHLERQKWQTVS